MDTTDWIRANPQAIILVLALAVALIFAAWSLFKLLSPSILSLSLAVNAIPSSFRGSIRLTATRYLASRHINSALLEKLALISPECIIFAQILPGVQARSIQIATAVAFVTVVNTAFSLGWPGRGVSWRSAIQGFLAMFAANFFILLLLYIFLHHRLNGIIDLQTSMFFVLHQ